MQEILDVPRDFIKDGSQFINRCNKRQYPSILPLPLSCPCPLGTSIIAQFATMSPDF
jgi:hypothetical protein